MQGVTHNLVYIGLYYVCKGFKEAGVFYKKGEYYNLKWTFMVVTFLSEYIFVKEVIDEWDPIGLLGMGCPDDEYDPEIRDIVRLLSNIKSVVELAEVIHNVFDKWFNSIDSIEYTFEKCYPVAIKIWNKLT
jgi:hypothetical protein